MPLSPRVQEREITAAAGRLGAARKNHPEQDHTALEVELKALRLRNHIQRVIDAAPPLTAKQRADLARILRGGSS